MAYNTNTKLLLNFNGSNGATTTTDTSQTPFAVTLANQAEISSTQGKFSSNSLRLGNPDGTRSIGTLALNSPAGALSTDRTSAKVFDFWFWRGLYGPPWGSHPLVSITFQNGDTLALWHGSTSIDIEVNGNNKDGSYTYANVAHYGSGSWDHYRLALYGATLWCGLNGSEVFTATNSTSNDLWVGDATNPITQFRIGGYPTAWGADANAFVVGYIDCFQVLDGDTSWLGGSYTVPTAAPDDYAGGGGGVTAALTGQSFAHAQGSLGKSRSRALTGQALTHAQGALVASSGKTVALTGQSYSYAQGALGKGRANTPAGQAVPYAQGSLNKSIGRAIDGQAYSYAQGSIAPVIGVVVPLTGQTIAYGLGSLGVPRSVGVAGQALSYSQGAISAQWARLVPLSGQSYGYSQGALAATITKVAALTGQSFTHAQGSLGVPRSVGLVGQGLAYAQGGLSVTTAKEVALTGQALNYTQGAFGKALAKALTGQSVPYVAGYLNTRAGAGENTTNDVTSAGFGGDLAANNYAMMTTLMLHGNTAGLLKDDSLHAQDATGVNLSSNTALPVIGDGAIQFAQSVSSDNGGELYPALKRGLFFNMASDKIFDFVLKLSAPSSYSVGGIFAASFSVTPVYPGSSSTISLSANTTTRKLSLTLITPGVNTSVETGVCFTLGTRFFVRLAFIGQYCYLCVNGTQLLSIPGTSGQNIWPSATYPHLCRFGYYYNSMYGTLDELRVQEGSVANHGYSGGNYTVDTNEWWPNRTTGTGVNTTEAITSTGAGDVIAEILGAGSVTLADTGNEGNVNVGVFREGVGANTLDALGNAGTATTLPLIYCDGASTTEAVTSTGDGSLSWVGRGANTSDAVVSTGAGTVADGVSLGANVVDSITSTGSGAVAIVGSGASATAFTSQGEGTTAAYGQGASSTSVTSSGAGYTDKYCTGANTTSAPSLGSGIVYTAGGGQSIVEHLSIGAGGVLITGIGGNTTGIYTFDGRVPEDKDADFERVTVRQKRADIFVRAQNCNTGVRAP